MASGSPMRGGIRLFKVFGITVYLHWLWFVVAIYEVQARRGDYSTISWNIAEYIALFLIVLMHEFGHALACRSVGGKAERILLWPFGGVAYVSPPQRPGAILWSIAAGPLVNVILAPITIGLFLLASRGYFPASIDLLRFLFAIAVINIALLVFNMFPVYPLDGGQILRALLWFVIGRAKSLLVAGVTGLAGAIGVAAAVLILSWRWYGGIGSGGIWLLLLAGLGAWQSWIAIKRWRLVAQIEAMPRHQEARCPSCKQSPPAAPLWQCACGANFDTFATGATCPSCGRRFEKTLCPECGTLSPYAAWYHAGGFPVGPRAGYSPAQPPMPMQPAPTPPAPETLPRTFP